MRFRIAPAAAIAAALTIVYGLARPSMADPTDLVPQGSSLLDAFARLADADAFGTDYSSADFYGTLRFTRGELAKILSDNCLEDETQISDLEASATVGPALIEAIDDLRPELDQTDAPIASFLDNMRRSPASLSGYVAPEYRAINQTPPFSDPKTLLGYRVADLGDLGPDSNYHVSFSNWPDNQRVFENRPAGTRDFTALNEAAVSWHEKHGVDIDLGRLFDQWGSGYLGDVGISENAPSFDQARIAFPFSLGRRMGRRYSYTEFAGTFDETGRRKYLLGRRIGYQLTNKLNVDYQELDKSPDTGSLWLIPIPFELKSANFGNLGLSGIKSNDILNNYVIEFGATYAATPSNRVYCQFLIDDLSNPLRSKPKFVPRKIGYLIGTSVKPTRDMNLVLEYGYVDPTTYTHDDPGAVWTHGDHDFLAIPSGPNSKDLHVRVDQKLNSKLTLTTDILDRRRDSLSFPEPTYVNAVGMLTYQVTRKNWVSVSFDDFKEDPFPIAPGSPNYPVPFHTPLFEGDQGVRARVQEWDFTFGQTF